MDDKLKALEDAIARWRSNNVDAYWVEVGYIGMELNRMGNHVLTSTGGTLWHLWNDEWREIEKGKDFWLYTVPGSFAWAREMLRLITGPEAADAVQLKFDDQYGYVKLLRVKMPERDAANFTFEIRNFGLGEHPEFKRK